MRPRRLAVFSTLSLAALAASASYAPAQTGRSTNVPGSTATSDASTKDKDDIFLKCSIKIGGAAVVTKDKFEALADNIADPDFAKNDPSCKGKKNNPEGVALALKTKTAQAGRLAHDMRDVLAARASVPGTTTGGIPADVLRTDFGMDKKPELPFLFRDAYSTYSLLNAPPAAERATGTQISFTDDFLNHNQVFSAKGAIIGWNVLSYKAGADNAFAAMGITRMLWAPGIEFDETRNHSDPKKNTDYVGFKFLGELEKETSGGLFPLQYFRYSGYWKTDTRGDSKIAGAYAEWEPINLDWAIGVAYRLFGGPVQFRWSPILHAETERVINAGLVTGIHTGDEYVRLGPIVQADIFFAEGPLRNLVFGAQYRYFANVADGGRAHDIHYFQTTATYNIDQAGNVALSVTYRDGITPGNTTRVRDLKTGLTVKY